MNNDKLNNIIINKIPSKRKRKRKQRTMRLFHKKKRYTSKRIKPLRSILKTSKNYRNQKGKYRLKYNPRYTIKQNKPYVNRQVNNNVNFNLDKNRIRLYQVEN